MSSNPYAAPRSTTRGAIHRLPYWKTKWAYAGIFAFGIVASLAGVGSSMIVFAMVVAALVWIKRTWEFLPPRHRGATQSWMAVALHCVPIVNVVWMVIFNRRVAEVLNGALGQWSQKRVSAVLAVSAAIGPALASAIITRALMSGMPSSPAMNTVLAVSAFVGRILYFFWMWRVDTCCEEILALQERAATEAPQPETARTKTKRGVFDSEPSEV